MEIKTTQDALNFINSCDTFLFDCDGVLWNGSHVIPKSVELLSYLKSKGKRTVLVSNNSTSSRKGYLKKLEAMKFSVNEDDIFPSSYAAAYYLKEIEKLKPNDKVYVVGMGGIVDELELAGFETLGITDNVTEHTFSAANELLNKFDPNVKAVVVGFDLHMNYAKLARAFDQLNRNSDCKFIATNDDSTFPIQGGVLPGTGAWVAALKECSQKEPVITGKPSTHLFNALKKFYGLETDKTCMIGDRIDTDIAFGKNHGMKSLLVLTGISSRSSLENTPLKPDYHIESVTKLFELINT
ncbi:2-phosphoglycolate phosphatase, eukaryotic domain-containing protein [Rozella allomycis CSF55]|uniref:4-nitrophenylphosphatase n=1 Tax=Rozella allomycis (strain CSF55) TaxID=988480 RepID=A0A075B219_ROZAC|nr:2-phosphoglycolate phosphatase, eukaryotic domain-containing protein [Rozella allomycis CSF55]|eukprot:EPZ34863.1 2-phosphoglycolate phosphatase, eukaryotic domain-containing protein [Rozella allomycis CSF55]